MPIKKERLPKISDNAIIVKYVTETKNMYRYRDKLWRWYKNLNSNYSGFYSEKPDGYSQRDTNTTISTDYTTWSIDYPEVKDYRTIKTGTGYRWYIIKDKKKVYYNGGEYLVEAPSEEYTADKETAIKMYSYSDKKWRWYNGTNRVYCSYMATANNYCQYKDEELSVYGNWSMWSEVSKLDSSNSSYREEEVDLYTKYLIYYKMESLDLLETSLPKEQFETKLGKTIEEVDSDDNLDLIVTFKFKNEK